MIGSDHHRLSTYPFMRAESSVVPENTGLAE